MINIPAICNSCGTIFPSGFVAENAFNITMSGNKSGPCPHCGKMGHIPDGTFNFSNNTIELLNGPERTVSELEKLKKLLVLAKEKSASPEEIKAIFLKESGEIKSIASLLPKNRSDLYAFIALIIMVIELILNQISANKPSRSNIEINTVINNIYQLKK